MNFNYNSGRNFVNYQFKGQKVEKKVKEEEKKQEEVKKEESVRQQTIAPKEAKVTAKSEELITNYIKGAMQMNKPDRAAATQQTGSVQGGTKDGDVQELINRWNAEHENMTREEKFDLLSQIIDFYVESGDSTQESIWRVRRYTVMFDHTEENLAIWNRMQNGGEYETPFYYTCSEYQGFYEDMEAWNSYNHGTLEGDERAVFLECCKSGYSTLALYYIIRTRNSNLTPEQIDSQKEQAKYSADWLMWILNEMVDGGFIEGSDWQDTYAQYQTKFDNFRDIMNNPDHPAHEIETHNIYTNEGASAVQLLVNDLTSMIDELREQNFPYCDELLIAIQGYLVYADHDDINVLPNPEGGDGGAKPELSAKVKKASVKDAR